MKKSSRLTLLLILLILTCTSILGCQKLEILQATLKNSNEFKQSLVEENKALKQQLETLQANMIESSKLQQSLLAKNKALEQQLETLQANIAESSKLQQSLLAKNKNLEQQLINLQSTIDNFSKKTRNIYIVLVALASSIGAIISLIGYTYFNKFPQNITNENKSGNIKISENQENSIQSTKDNLKIKTEYDKKLNELQDRFKILEQSLSTESNTATLEAIRINGALELPKIIKIDFSKNKLVEIYSDCPQVLSSNVVTVSVTADSYRQKTQGQIFLERTGRGNYWIIATKNEKYWLLPNSNISINLHKLKTIQFLFECIGEYSSSNGDFTLSQPARVSILPNRQWKLEQKGKLVFGNNTEKEIRDFN